MEILQSVQVLTERMLCKRCLGRCFGKLGRGLTNLERGDIIFGVLTRTGMGMAGTGSEPAEKWAEFHKIISDGFAKLLSSDETLVDKAKIMLVPPERCHICEGLMGELEYFAAILLKELDGYEFNNFLVGCKVDDEVIAREEDLWRNAGLAYPESIKSELNREVGKILNNKLGKPTEFANPEVVALIDTRFNVGEVQSTPIFFYGRYLKLSREIPQTRWLCRKCRGRGCGYCGGTGKMYQTSVEELIASRAAEMAKARDFALHGLGREDIDVLTLGNGRPFVLELTAPIRRSLELNKLEEDINNTANGKIRVEGLRMSDRDEMQTIKMGRCFKTYRCKIDTELAVSNEKLKMVVNTFLERVITQKTPIRVLHRRADKIRKRLVSAIKVVAQNNNEIILEITGESGLYIKELIHGDDSRTRPNLSEELGQVCQVRELDVIQIHDDKLIIDENGSD